MCWQWNQTGNEEQKGNKNVSQYPVTKQYTYQNLWDAAKAVLVEIHSTKCLIKKVLSQ